MTEPVKRTIQPAAYIRCADKAFEDNDVEGFCGAFHTHKEFLFYCKQVRAVEQRMRVLRDNGTLSGQGLEEYASLAKKVAFVDAAAAVYEKRQAEEAAQVEAGEQADAEKREQDEEHYRSIPDEDEEEDDDEEPMIGCYEGPFGIELM